MDPAESNFLWHVVPAVRRIASMRFDKDPQRDTLILDAISVAWELHRRKPAAPPKQIAIYATRRVKVGRQFRQSIRSIDGPNPRGVAKAPRAEDYDPAAYCRAGDDPAELAAVRIDYPPWQAALSERQQAMLAAFLSGETSRDLAERYGITPTRINQIRRELVESWLEYTA